MCTINECNLRGLGFFIFCNMVLNIRLIVLVLFSSLLTGCSFQKRTLMPGYHVEWAGGQNEPSVPHASPDELAELEWAMAGTLPNELPAAELTRPTLLHANATPMAQTRCIPPKGIAVNPAPAALQEPTPWAEAYKEQQRYGNLALIAFGLAVLFASIGAPQMLIVAAGLAGISSFILNRRKSREVIDIREFNGYDVTEERRNFKTTNRLLGGAALVVIIGYIIVAILAALAFIALIEGLFSW